ncbi:Metacaspase-4 Short=AtMC4 [Rhizoctonia solani AG-1 IB]|uniref:Metacaspase-4 Short=AtMC4 n=1 Tax=Thanatephorus cucumeris (strain AG1-IB / isolate 7/3/14) TaxID=1108050 RepID=M5C6S2_THACB|nr:Metacaspase-4 Short=AtMC4 [Rhizoctonia solani AG-1 IB]
MLSLNSLRSSDPAPAAERAVSKGTVVTSDREALETLKGYIQASGQLTGSQPNSPRRALIIAVQYGVHVVRAPLAGTVRDAVLAYRMLCGQENSFGYKPTEIRILVEGLESLDSKIRPTPDNIRESLKWLVEGAGSEDYRFLYYSGHGTYVETNEKDGKQALEIPSGNPRTGDPDLDRSSANTEQWNRIRTLDVPKDKLKYYKEAIVASYALGGSNELSDYFIYDQELNDYMSKLPPGCKLTSLIDACHSGRILNCNFKEEGDGFRAIGHGSGKEAQDRAEVDASSTQDAPSSEDLEDPSEAAKLLEEIRTSTKYTFAPGLTSAPLVTLTEDLPDKEKQRDKIVAEVLHWSGCHQRQTSILAAAASLSDHNLRSYVIQAFAETVKASDVKSWTVQKVFDELNKAIKAASSNHLQYAQVWTSLGKGSKEDAVSSVLVQH